jgi:hypothetical protein
MTLLIGWARWRKTMDKRLVLLDRHIGSLQKERDDLEWSGEYARSDFLQKLIDDAIQMRDKGDTHYPLF